MGRPGAGKDIQIIPIAEIRTLDPYALSNHWMKVIIRYPIIVEQPCMRKLCAADRNYWRRVQLISSQHSQQVG